MPLSPREVAEAFSSHDFEPAFAHLSDAVVWRTPGDTPVEGRDAVVALCRTTAEALAETDVRRERFLVVDGGDAVVVDTLTVYRDADLVSTVASCDIYEFRDGEVVTLTSYNVEV